MQVEECPGATIASPHDPCVCNRGALGAGDIQLRVPTPTASAWNFAIPAPAVGGIVELYTDPNARSDRPATP